MEQHPIMEQDDEIEIDLAEIAYLLWQNVKWLIAFFAIGAVIAMAITQFLIVPKYQSTSKIYILSQTTSLTSFADLQMGESLTADFSELAKSRPVVETVIKELNLDTTYESFLHIMTPINPSDTRILALQIEHEDPQLAADISNALAISLVERVAFIMNTERPTIVEEAVPGLEPVSPSLLKNTAIGAMLGLFVIIGLLLLKYFLDDTIKDSSDVEKYLHLNVIASIPMEIDKDTPEEKRSLFGKKRTSSSHGSSSTHKALTNMASSSVHASPKASVGTKTTTTAQSTTTSKRASSPKGASTAKRATAPKTKASAAKVTPVAEDEIEFMTFD